MCFLSSVAADFDISSRDYKVQLLLGMDLSNDSYMYLLELISHILSNKKGISVTV